MTFHAVRDVITDVVTIGSLLYSILPDWESFSDYPAFQKCYKFFMLFVVKTSSVNFRSMVHPKIQATSNEAGTESR